MSRVLVCALAGALVVLAVAGAVPAQTRDQLATRPDPSSAATAWDVCRNGLNGVRQVIDACTSVISSSGGTNLALALYFRGSAYKYDGQRNRALQDFDRALALDPGSHQVLVARADMFDGVDYDRAIADLDRAVGANPTNAMLFVHRAITREHQGRDDLAIADLTQAIVLEPTTEWILVRRGAAYFRAGDYDRAMADFSSAVERRPRSAPALYGRGSARLARGDSSGNADLLSASQIQPDIAGYMASMGVPTRRE